MLWKLPALDENTHAEAPPVFPAGAHGHHASGAAAMPRARAVQRWRMQVAGGLTGRTIKFPELAGHPHRRAGAL